MRADIFDLLVGEGDATAHIHGINLNIGNADDLPAYIIVIWGVAFHQGKPHILDVRRSTSILHTHDPGRRSGGKSITVYNKYGPRITNSGFRRGSIIQVSEDAVALTHGQTGKSHFEYRLGGTRSIICTNLQNTFWLFNLGDSRPITLRSSGVGLCISLRRGFQLCLGLCVSFCIGIRLRSSVRSGLGAVRAIGRCGFSGLRCRRASCGSVISVGGSYASKQHARSHADGGNFAHLLHMFPFENA